VPLAAKDLRRGLANLLRRRDPDLSRRAVRTASTRIRPPLRSRWRRPTVMGAACTRFVVNIAAALAIASATATAKSVFPLGLMPAFTAANRNPRGSASCVITNFSVIVSIPRRFTRRH
jgi:hypothetical protein